MRTADDRSDTDLFEAYGRGVFAASVTKKSFTSPFGSDEGDTSTLPA